MNAKIYLKTKFFIKQTQNGTKTFKKAVYQSSIPKFTESFLTGFKDLISNTIRVS